MYNPDLDPLVQAIAMDDRSVARLERLKEERLKEERLKQMDRDQNSLPEANTPASKPGER